MRASEGEVVTHPNHIRRFGIATVLAATSALLTTCAANSPDPMSEKAMPPSTRSDEQYRESLRMGERLTSCAGFQWAMSDLLTDPDAVRVAQYYAKYYEAPALILFSA